ncbi:Retrovirus-related Pol polyprotein from transposon TNT 1-94 [Bienertia sinuspersici]
MAGTSCFLSGLNAKWLLDSGATDHVCTSLDLFDSYHSLSDTNDTITIPDGRRVVVKHKGAVKLNNNITLMDVLHVPDFYYNLVSVHKLCSDLGCTITFTHDKCFVQDKSQTELSMLLGNLEAGLYKVGDRHIQNSSTILSSYATSSSVDEVKLWHLRLGHLPFNKLHYIFPTLSLSNKLHDSFCRICPRAKQTRQPFVPSSSYSTLPFALIHVDLWGPYQHKTYTGCNQFLTIVDDHTRFTWVHLLKYKSDVVSILDSFFNYVETQFGTKVACVRSDNARELTEGDMKRIYALRGIIHQTSCYETPEQNAIVERKHRHLLETARTLYFHSYVPERFWGECVLTAAYLINRMPLKPLGFKTPFHMLFQSDPPLHHLKVFGCLCYLSTTKAHRTKFEPRANPGVFLGYSVTQKGYKVWDLHTKRLVVSRNVVFYERHFPFHLSFKHSHPEYASSADIFAPSSDLSSLFDEGYHVPQSSESSHPTHITPHSSPLYSHISSVPTSPQTSSTAPVSNSPSSSVKSSFDPSNLVIDITDTISTNTDLRRSSRPHKVPSYLTDYKCNGSISSSSHWCNLVSSISFSSSHKSFLSSVCEYKEPKSFKEASTKPEWVEAMQKEIDALNKNNTWTFVDLPKGKKAIGSKWVYKVKLKADGTLDRCKARLVAHGCNQKHGVDYEETFSPVIKMTTVRCLIAVAAHRKWPMYQLDVNNAFLHGELTEEVYMKVPSGIPNPDQKVCKLNKSLYGLKQASRQWFAKLVSELIQLGFIQSKNDYSLFIKHTPQGITLGAVYVDDILVTGNDSDSIVALKSHLDKILSIKDLGLLNYFLGIEVGYADSGVILTQRKFTKELLETAGLELKGKATTPLPVDLKLSATTGVLLDNPEHYRSLVGKLNFLTTTRPDLAYAVQDLSQFMQLPRSSHMEALKHTLQYVSFTMDQGILLQGSDQLTLQAFSDSNWGACPDTRKSITGYVLLLGKSPISWKSKKQTTISRSSSEAEYRAMASAAAEVAWVVRLLEELDIHHLKPVTLHCDNQSALYIAKNPVFHERTKHIEIDYHFTRDKVLEGLLQLSYLPTSSQLADVFTKPLTSPQFGSLLSKLGLYVPSSPNLRGGIGRPHSSCNHVPSACT